MVTKSIGFPTDTQRLRVRQTSNEADSAELKPAVRWGFCLLIFSLPFELPQAGLPLEVTTLTAAIFLITTLLQPRVCFKRPPRSLWCFGLFLYIYLFSMVYHSVGYSRVELQMDQAKLLLLLVQIMLLCWAGCNVMRDERSARAGLFTFAASCSLLAVIHIFGFARTSTEVASNIERLSTFGQNPNTLARNLSIGVLISVGLGYGRQKAALRYSFLVWPVVALILVAIESTGARGSLIALGSGLLFFAFGGDGAKARARNILVVVLAIGFGVWMSLRSETMTQRFEKSFDEGSMAQRENLYPAAWRMFLDKPVLGWGPTLNMWELGSRVGEPDHPFRDTHDLLLEILTVTGALGAIPFLAGVLLCLHAAWKGRAGVEGVLPVATMVGILVANIGANLLYNKLYWLLMAYALASNIEGTRRKRRSLTQAYNRQYSPSHNNRSSSSV